MNRDDFFRHVIDGYLFLDLRNMSELEQKDGENGGGVGYPMLATCVSGMELLGGLLYRKDYSHVRNWNYFEHYWNNYLAKVDARYTPPLGKMVWDLVRNGVAHTYMAKAAITVTKGQEAHHLVFYDGNTKFNIDCRQFYKDFLASYEQQVKPKLAADDSFTTQVQKNIDIMLKESDDFCNEVFATLQTSPTPNPAPAGASGPTPSGTQLTTTTTTLIPDEVRAHIDKISRPRISGASLIRQEQAEGLKKQLEQDGPPPTMSGAI